MTIQDKLKESIENDIDVGVKLIVDGIKNKEKNKLTKDEREWLINSIGILQRDFLENNKAKEFSEIVKQKIYRM